MILESQGARSSQSAIEEFLGRKPSSDAFFRDLEIEERSPAAGNLEKALGKLLSALLQRRPSDPQKILDSDISCVSEAFAKRAVGRISNRRQKGERFTFEEVSQDTASELKWSPELTSRVLDTPFLDRLRRLKGERLSVLKVRELLVAQFKKIK